MKSIVLVAHDNKKKDIVEWGNFNESAFKILSVCNRNHRKKNNPKNPVEYKFTKL